MFQTPPLLQAGDTVTIAATARKVHESEMADAVALFKSWGLNLVLHPYLYASENQFAGNDLQRAELLQWAIENSEIKAIFCARGGYGTVRMIDLVDLKPLQNHPKWIIGFSDITVLICQLLTNQKLCSIHGPMAFNFQQSKQHKPSIQHLKKTLFEGPQAIRFKTHYLNFTTNPDFNPYPIIGGNLSVLYAILGSNSFPLLDHCYLFLEDLDKYLYHIDRMLQALRKRAHVLNKLKGILVGDMSDMKDNAISFGKNAYEIILELGKSLHIPVIFGLPVGHEPHNESIVIGHSYRLELNQTDAVLIPV